MANKAVDFDDMPSHPNEKRVSGHNDSTNSFVRGGGKKAKGKKKGHKKHAKK